MFETFQKMSYELTLSALLAEIIKHIGYEEYLRTQFSSDEFQSKKENLEEKIESLKTDRGIEAELRGRFNITKEGETMIRVIENEPEENPTGDDIPEE